ncbi:MAG: 3-dehydro-L-gulonate 2-dehydrogenase [Bacteroidetes bacterium]|nr:3-dehydro-L-gulonate 2-dehydrogenase [Bacteroidota bacterium]
MDTIKIPYAQLVQTLEKILMRYRFSQERAHLCATLFAKASLDGVASHGLNRFSTFLQMIEEGYVQPAAEPALKEAYGPFERWDGKLGPGPLNAHHCMDRAISLAKSNGIGCVALGNTNHWMRGGNYGWQAVENDCIGICFTNTKPNMPAWGGAAPVLGNNPLVVAIPRQNGPLVLDMAMSQFSYGKMSSYLRAGQQLPYDGGFDAKGRLSRDPAHMLEKELALPIGLWKGAGLSLMLDVLAAVLAEGQATHQIGQQGAEWGVSQVFLCFSLEKLGIANYPVDKIDAIIEQLMATTVFEGREVRYPGERTLQTRSTNLKEGVPVERAIWEEVLKISHQGVDRK